MSKHTDTVVPDTVAADSFVTDAEKVRRLPWYIAHSGANAAFSALTWFGPVFVLFLDELGLPKTRIGVILSFLPFSGVLALFVAPTVARLGVKRVFIACWGTRKLVTLGLLLTPAVLARAGVDGAFGWVVICMALFALLRAIAETGYYPWVQEIIPSAMRGRVNGINYLVSLLASSSALLTASWVLDEFEGLERFQILIGAGALIGVVCVACALPVPGGAPGRLRETAHGAAMRDSLRDPRLVLYLIYAALTLLVMQSVFSAFIPLLMREQVGLPASRIVLLDVSAAAVGVLSSYAWGWWSDRRGTQPLKWVLGIMLVLPLLWMALPRQQPSSFGLAIIIACLAGAATNGWWIADQRMLYNDVVPPERRTEYLALYYAWIGFVGGCGPLLAGVLLDAGTGLSDEAALWGPFHIDAYTPLLTTGMIIVIVAAGVLRRLRVHLAGNEVQK